jgi:hypothetical protein
LSTTGPDSAKLILIVLLVQFAATWAMIGIIWFVQAVHYPLFLLMGSGDFKGYQHKHTRLTQWIVGPPMLVEGLTAAVLVWYPPTAVPRSAASAGLFLLGAIWVSTALVQVPLHNRLARGFETTACRKLVVTNWLRTVAWSLRGLVTAWMLWKTAS